MDQKKISVAEFARRQGLNPSSVSAYFRKGYNPSLHTLLRWARALECDLRELLDSELPSTLGQTQIPRPRSATKAIDAVRNRKIRG